MTCDPPASAPATVETILLVDDDLLLLEAVGFLVQRLGYHAVTAATGEEALALLEAGLAPCLVVLDMDMPGLGGAGTLPRLRRLRPDLPVLISTGGNNPVVAQLLASHPGVSLLPKPYGLQELRARLT